MQIEGIYPEIELKDIHFCTLPNCDRKMTVFFGMDICVDKEKTNDIICKILEIKEFTDKESADTKWRVTIEKIDENTEN